MQTELPGWAMKSQLAAFDMSIGGRPPPGFAAAANAGTARATTTAVTVALNQVLIELASQSFDTDYSVCGIYTAERREARAAAGGPCGHPCPACENPRDGRTHP